MSNRLGIDAAKRIRIGEPFGLIAIGGLALFFLVTSWRKWPDPLIDFGRELYLPWRLANGAVLYRDVDDFYGPLSQYFNAVLFKCFGAGLMVLVTANLAVFAAISAIIYVLCRRAWGTSAALTSTAVFVAVFGFSQFTGAGNYNYATPYAHETTHGLLVCLLLVVTLVRWMEGATVRLSFLAGVLLGLTAVLKPEIMLAAGLTTSTAVLMHWWYQRQLKLPIIAAWTCGAVLPTLGFVVFFAAYLPWQEAVRVSCTAWLNTTTTTRFTSDVIQQKFLGFDQPWEHLLEHLGATLLACMLIAVIAGAAWLAERRTRKWMCLALSGCLTVALLWLACFQITWPKVGQCLLGLMIIYTFISGATLFPRTNLKTRHDAQVVRLLMAVIATALMARMALNGRIYQYGYYQAALAGLLVPAVLIGELPMRLGMGRCGRSTIIAASLALLVPGVVILVAQSQHMLRLKTLPIGEGRDRFYAFPPQLEPIGEIVRVLSESLRKTPRTQTLLVLPEGEMINYLARLACPVSQFFFYSVATAGGREEAIVNELKRRPPEWIVIISRDLREYGVERYGEKPGSGEQILQWVDDNYQRFASAGGNPLDYRQRGGIILKRKLN